MNVRLDAIVNDSSSTLLARAYLDPATRLACILGTGMNAAVHLPIAALHPSKFAFRSLPKNASITHVLTNTELSMYGKDIFRTTRWDDCLNQAHILPDYQPFEYLIAGGYISEIVRHIIVEAIDKAGLFHGTLPALLKVSYSLDTKMLAEIETDTSVDFVTARSLLQQQCHTNSLPNINDVIFVSKIVRSVTSRSIAFFAAGIHALSSLLQEVEDNAGLRDDLDRICIGCDGSVINKYPAYMDRVQDTLDEMNRLENLGRKKIVLDRTQDSAVTGAGVAAAMAALSSTATG